MATVSRPLQPPTPPSLPPSRNQHRKSSPPPKPGYAAIPFDFKESPPVQETSPSPETLYETEGDAPATPQLLMENEPQFPPSQGQEDHSSDGEEKHCPVQETGPGLQIPNAPQVTEPEDEAASQMEQTGEDQSPEALQ